MRGVYEGWHIICHKACASGTVAFGSYNGVAWARPLGTDPIGAPCREVLDAIETEPGVLQMHRAEKHWPTDTEFGVFRSVAVIDLEKPRVDEVLERDGLIDHRRT